MAWYVIVDTKVEGYKETGKKMNDEIREQVRTLRATEMDRPKPQLGK
jgi:hypothetical protein